MLACFFIMCFFCLSIPKVVFGQSPAEQVFNDDKYKELFKRPEIIKELPDALRLFIEVGMDRPFRSNFLANPRFLLGIDDHFDDDFTDEFILLLTVDEDLRSLFWDGQFYEVLTDPDEINKLIKLIESIVLPPAKLIIIGGNNQQGNPNTDLGEPLKIEVQDANENSLANIKVIFTVIKGNATLSTKEVTTNANGEAETTLTLGPNEGIILIEARVKGTDLMDTNLVQTFTVVAVTDAVTSGVRSIVYITVPTNKTNYTVDDEFTLRLNIVNPGNASKFEATVRFNSEVFECVSEQDETVEIDNVNGTVKIEKNINENTNILDELTFKVIGIKSSELTLSEVILYGGNALILNTDIVFTPRGTIPEDVNVDGIVNILDLVRVANHPDYNEPVGKYLPEDVNEDGVINILDLVLISYNLGVVNTSTGLLCVH